MNKTNKVKTKRIRTTWSFEPTKQVRKLVLDHLRDNPLVTRTELLNRAVLNNFPEALLKIAEAELEKQKQRVRALRAATGGKS